MVIGSSEESTTDVGDGISKSISGLSVVLSLQAAMEINNDRIKKMIITFLTGITPL